MYETWTLGEETRYRFNNEESAKEMVNHLGLTVTEFMESTLFSTLENQFTDRGWGYPDKLTWDDFVNECLYIWIGFDGNIVYLANDQMESFLESFEMNFNGFISERVFTANLGASFVIEIGNRTVKFDSNYQFITSGSIIEW